MIKHGAKPTVFIAGATGYIGGRLIPRLLDQGYPVKALARNPEKLSARPWAAHPQFTICKGDILDQESLKQSMSGCQAAYYLVHSMNPEVRDFAETDRLAATNMANAAAANQLQQIIYLGGLGDQQGHLSHHLQSRSEVGEILQQGSVPVTILRAAMIIGSGSASFEILRYLVEHLPVMITPRWVNTPCQPIGIRNVLHYLTECLEQPQMLGQTYDIGQPNIYSYRELMEIYADEAGLHKRWIIPVPVLTPRLSSYWIHMVTPVPAAIARPLAEGLSNPVICREHRITHLIPQQLFDARKAIRLALERTRQHSIETTWSDSGQAPPAEWRIEGDPEWAGGHIFKDSRSITLEGQPAEIWPAIKRLGGDVGYYYADWLWRLRGFIDKLCGGVGLRRGRRSAEELYPGDALDFWRVVAIEKDHFLMLSAEMKLPGKAVLQFRLKTIDQRHTELIQTAYFLPRGLAGLLYWYAVLPFHHFVFNGMLRGIAEAAGKNENAPIIKQAPD